MMKKTPISFQMRRNRHKQVSVIWQQSIVKIDVGLELLFYLFNDIPGIATVASCVGDKENLGYVAFAGDSQRLVKSWVRKLKVADLRGVFDEVSYREDTHFGCVRFKHVRIGAVCRLVSGIVEE